MSKEREERKVVKVGMGATGATGVKGSKEEIFDSLGKQDEKDTIEHLRAQLREQNSIIRKYQESRGGQIELSRKICEAIKAVSSYPLLKYKPVEPSSSEIPLIINISDWHIGEITRPAETGGFGSFNFSIAQKRAFKYVENILEWLTLQRKGYNIPDLEIFGIGDYVSGSIHGELLVTNEFPLPVQAAKSGSLIAECVRRLAPHFRSIHFHGVGADNHGRLQAKPQAKQKAANNMSFVVHSMIEAYLSSHKNIRVTQYEDMKPVIEVARHRFLVQHGDNIKGQMGIPYYGFAREKGREAVKRMSSKAGFEYMQIGHWHVPGVVEETIYVNGSLSGTSEFDHACGRHAKPAQVTYLVHPRWGEFGRVSWRFGIEQDETDARRK